MYRETLPVLLIALLFAIAIYADPLVMANDKGEMITHWGITGQPDGYMGKAVGLYLIPILTLVFYLVFLLIPRIEVYKANMEEFSQQFWGFRVVFIFAMGVIYVATLIPNLGYWRGFDPTPIVLVAVAMLFFYTGYMLNFTKRNYFIGVRTPWTLADEKVWDRTNKLTGKLFWVCGVLTLVALIAPSDMRLWMIIAPLILLAIFAFLYSLYEYKKLRGELGALSGKKGKIAKRKAKKKS